MLAFLPGVAAVAVTVTLLAAAFGHLRRPAALPTAIKAHGVLPARVAVQVATAAIAAEGTVAVVAAVGLVASAGRLLAAALVFAAVLLSGYGGYAWRATAVAGVAGSGPCGCGGTVETPMNGWVAGRAFALAALALVGLAWPSRAAASLGTGAGVGANAAAGHTTIVLLAAATFAVLLWQLPAALNDPARLPVGRQRSGRPAAR